MDAPKRMLPPALAANRWRPGQSGNPLGHSGAYGEAMRLARQAAPNAVQRLIELAEIDQVDDQGNLLPLSKNADPRVVAVVATGLIERAFGKSKTFEPKDEPNPSRPKFDPRLLTPEQLDLVEHALKLMVQATRAPTGLAEVRTGRPDESEPER
jgi:hypothetical protein